MKTLFYIQDSTGNADEVYARFGVSLISVNKPANAAEETEMLRKAIAWHENLFRSISFEYRDAVKLNLIYLASTGHSIECRLLVTVIAATQKQLGQILLNVQTDLCPLFFPPGLKGGSPYLFREITDPSLLRYTDTAMFKNSATLFFRKPVKAAAGEMGFVKTRTGHTKNDTGIHSLRLMPLSGQWRPDDEFFKALYVRKVYTEVDVELRPYHLSDDDIANIRRVIKNPFLLSGNLPEEEIPGYIKGLRKLLASRNDKFHISIILKTTDDRPEQYLKSAIHRYFFGSGAKIGQQKTDAGSALRRVGGKLGESPLSFIYAAPDAMQAFRMPMPIMNNLPGFKQQDFVFQQFPASTNTDGLLLGVKKTVQEENLIRLSENALARHLYIMGQTGTGKSTLLKTMIKDCLQKKHGFTLIDPHGDLYEEIESLIPPDKKENIFFIDPSKPEISHHINPLFHSFDRPQEKSLLINELLRIIGSLYDMRVAGGPMFEMYFKYGLLLVMNKKVSDEFGILTMADFGRLFFDDNYRKALLAACDDPSVNRFFATVLKTSGEQSFVNYGPYITSKINRFVEDYFLQPLVTENSRQINFREMMDKGGILLVRMDKGKLGADNTSLLGQLVLSKLFLAGMSRTDMLKADRNPYYIFIDEFQNFMRGDVGSALSEMRKYGLSLVLANQTLGQLDNFLVESLLGNVGNMLFFRPGINDYERIRQYLEPEFSRQDVLKLPNFHCIARLMYDNMPEDPFVFETRY